MKMLNQHPLLHVINETHWIPKLYEFFGPGRSTAAEMLAIVDMTHHVNGRPTTPLSQTQRDALLAMPGQVTIREFADALAASVAGVFGKSIWADKTPDYGMHMAMIQSLWPECRFIHLIRDGAHVAQSMSTHPGYRLLTARDELSWTSIAHGMADMWTSTPPSDIDSFLRLWRFRVERARSEAKSLAEGTYVEVRYESLTAEPKPALRRIAAFTGLVRRDESWLAAAAALIEPGRGAGRGVHVVTSRTDRRAVALMESLGYQASMSRGGRP